MQDENNQAHGDILSWQYICLGQHPRRKILKIPKVEDKDRVQVLQKILSEE